MDSLYDSIKTPAELVSEVMTHGLSLKQEDICRAQDIIGRAPIEELVFLANDIGRENEDGKPDQEGTYGNGRRPTQGTFYAILTRIWNWEDVTRFWNEHTNYDRKRLIKEKGEQATKVRAEVAEHQLTKHQLEERSKRVQNLNEQLQDAGATICDQFTKIDGLQRENDAMKQQIMELKAKLYDMMTKEAK